MKNLAVVALILAAGCSTDRPYESGSTPDMVVKDREFVPPMDAKRKVSDQDCSKPVEIPAGNLMCK